MAVSIKIPDVSEWQGGDIDWPTVVRSGYPAVILRAYNGFREDRQFHHNRAAAHAAGIKALGLYAYLDASHSPQIQAREFITAIGGKLHTGEWAIVDCETGDRTAAAVHTWVSEVTAALGKGHAPWLYSGASYYREHDLSSAGVPASRTWIAAYGQAEPTLPHELWQYTSSGTVPGIKGHVDVSVYHGTTADLLKAVSAPVPAPAKPAPAKPAKGPTKHIVAAGETLSGIAAAHHMTWQHLWSYLTSASCPLSAAQKKQLSSFGPNRIFPGQLLYIPAS